MKRVVWLKLAEELRNKQASISDPNGNDLRESLISLDELIRSSPQSIRGAFKNLSEEILSAMQRKCVDAIYGGSIEWKFVGGWTSEEIAYELGAQIRALDETLKVWTSDWPNRPESWLSQSRTAYVVPRNSWTRRIPRTGDRYEKRGLIYNRIIPAEVDGYTVEIVSARMLGGLPEDAESPLLMGACLFSDLILEPHFFDEDTDHKSFAVKRASCTAADPTLDGHLAEAANARCRAVVWPELSMPPDLRKRLIKKLAEAVTVGRPPSIVVAGSWHEEDALGTRHNRARIYDGYGRPLLVHDKLLAYSDAQWGSEVIEPGDKISILEDEGDLFAFAICLDFCELTSETYSKLAVDYVLVPSMGNDATMSGHVNRASKIQAAFGTRVFVVQHAVPSLDGRLGSILPLAARPADVAFGGVPQHDNWKTYQRD